MVSRCIELSVILHCLMLNCLLYIVTTVINNPDVLYPDSQRCWGRELCSDKSLIRGCWVDIGRKKREEEIKKGEKGVWQHVSSINHCGLYIFYHNCSDQHVLQYIQQQQSQICKGYNRGMRVCGLTGMGEVGVCIGVWNQSVNTSRNIYPEIGTALLLCQSNLCV